MESKDNSKQKISCNICSKNIRGNARAVCCDSCNKWVHIKCNSISKSKYTQLCDENNDEPFLCLKCFNDELPFGYQNDKIEP